MEQKRRGKVIFRSGSLALKIIVAVLIVFSMAALAALRWVHTGIQARTGELRDEAAALEHQNSELEEKNWRAGLGEERGGYRKKRAGAG